MEVTNKIYKDGPDSKMSLTEAQRVIDMVRRIAKNEVEGFIFVLDKSGNNGEGFIYGSGVPAEKAIEVLVRSLGGVAVEVPHKKKKND